MRNPRLQSDYFEMLYISKFPEIPKEFLRIFWEYVISPEELNPHQKKKEVSLPERYDKRKQEARDEGDSFLD